MASADKKLTVAYGVFSCTLEGFDDPVGAMADVVERLRDVAERDPHFGAVPPLPDPQARTRKARLAPKDHPDAPSRNASRDPVEDQEGPAPEGPASLAPKAAPWDAPGNGGWDDVAHAGPPGPAPSHPAPPGRLQAARATAPDPDLERLFAATDSRLTDEDASRRNATISHLKAAAAARRTDGDASPAGRDVAGAWRDDLLRAVRSSPHDRTIEGRATSAPPLVLVSAQRVPREPARPLAPDFARDWAQAGQTGTDALVAAAAAHLVRTTGSATFSRPRLLALAAEAPEGADREAVQVAFGRLLRTGRLRREEGGLYGLADDAQDVG